MVHRNEHGFNQFNNENISSLEETLSTNTIRRVFFLCFRNKYVRIIIAALLKKTICKNHTRIQRMGTGGKINKLKMILKNKNFFIIDTILQSIISYSLKFSYLETKNNCLI